MRRDDGDGDGDERFAGPYRERAPRVSLRSPVVDASLRLRMVAANALAVAFGAIIGALARKSIGDVSTRYGATPWHIAGVRETKRGVLFSNSPMTFAAARFERGLNRSTSRARRRSGLSLGLLECRREQSSSSASACAARSRRATRVSSSLCTRRRRARATKTPLQRHALYRRESASQLLDLLDRRRPHARSRAIRKGGGVRRTEQRRRSRRRVRRVLSHASLCTAPDPS